MDLLHPLQFTYFGFTILIDLAWFERQLVLKHSLDKGYLDMALHVWHSSNWIKEDYLAGETDYLLAELAGEQKVHLDSLMEYVFFLHFTQFT